MNTKSRVFLASTFFICLFMPIISVAQIGLEWGRQLGTEAEDFGKSVDVDSAGNVYITGWTNDTKNIGAKGGYDVFVCKMDPSGKTLWYKQYGTPKNERAEWITYQNGSIIVAGTTEGDFEEANVGEADAFIFKLDLDGNIQWIKQIGSKSAEGFDFVTLDNLDNIYCIGITLGDVSGKPIGKRDALVVKFDKTGNVLWKEQCGTAEEDAGEGLFVDNKYNVYICGIAHGPQYQEGQDKTDAFYAKYDKDGKQIWYKEFGTDKYDNAQSILVDNEGNMYIGGSTGGLLGNAQLGYGDSFLVKISPKHQMIWKKQFGTKLWDGVLCMKFNPASNSILLSGCQNYDLCQGFCREYDKAGKLIWDNALTAQDKTRGGTCGKSIAIDKNSNIYHTGGTGADIFATNQGLKDIYVVKLRLLSK